MRRASHPIRFIAAAAGPLAAVLLLLPACVTERTTAPTYGIHSGNRAPAPRNTPSASGAPVTLPPGPVATPVSSGSTLSSRVRTAMLDLGTVPSNGQVLPLVSPDGRFIAVQDGEPPTWPTLLAAPGAEVPHGAVVTAYSLPDPNASDPSGQPPAAQRLNWEKPVQATLLGRSSNASGFLVESPQPDGSRWIGHVSWVSGNVNWLVKSPEVNAYAVFGPDGELAYCRRAVDSNTIQLVVRPGANDAREFVTSPRGGGYLFPLFSDEPGIVYAFSLVAGVAELHALKIPQRGDPPNLLIVGRQPLLKDSDATTVYQMTAAVQTPLPRTLTTPSAAPADRQESERFDKLLFFHAGQGRMCIFDRRVGAIVPLFKGSFAAAPIIANENDPAAPRSGYLVTSQNELEYVSWSQKSEFDRARGVPASVEDGVTVIKGAYIPRLTSDPTWSTVLLGPAAGTNGSRIHLFRLRLEGADVRAP